MVDFKVLIFSVFNIESPLTTSTEVELNKAPTFQIHYSLNHSYHHIYCKSQSFTNLLLIEVAALSKPKKFSWFVLIQLPIGVILESWVVGFFLFPSDTVGLGDQGRLNRWWNRLRPPNKRRPPLVKKKIYIYIYIIFIYIF